MAEILVINAHPGHNRLCTALADAYAAGVAERRGPAAVRRINLGDLSFDPILHEGYAVIQELEPDLQDAQRAVSEARHIVWVFPSWWGSVPAVLKGFLDRILLPGFGFKFAGPTSLFWKKLLSGKTAEFLITMDGPPAVYYLMGGVGRKVLKYPLSFCGIRLKRTSLFGSVKRSDSQQIRKWLDRAHRRGARA